MCTCLNAAIVAFCCWSVGTDFEGLNYALVIKFSGVVGALMGVGAIPDREDVVGKDSLISKS